MTTPSKEALKHSQKGKKQDVQKGDLLDDKVLEWLKDPDVINELPASAKAQIILSRIPKAQVVDQKFEERMLSLTSILEKVGLDDRNDRFQKMATQTDRIRGELLMEQARSLFFSQKLTGGDTEALQTERAEMVEKVWIAACNHYKRADTRAEVLALTLTQFLEDFNEKASIAKNHDKVLGK